MYYSILHEKSGFSLLIIPNVIVLFKLYITVHRKGHTPLAEATSAMCIIVEQDFEGNLWSPGREWSVVGEISHYESLASRSPDPWRPYLTFLFLTVPYPAPVQALACSSDLASAQSQVKPHDLVVTDKPAGVRPLPPKETLLWLTRAGLQSP